MIGQTIAEYKILEKLGEGGMGVVYKAEDTKLKRIVALKFLPAATSADQSDVRRFVDEAITASALDHPNICTIHGTGETSDGRTFLVMAYYEGETLNQTIASNTLTMEEVFDVALQISRGLAKVHARGVVHRDIKPSNIMVTKDRTVKILDFGLAKLRGRTKVTKTGTTVGTAAYMSPEQARGNPMDHRSDIFSFGVVLYEMITGHRPFRGDYDAAIIYSLLNEQPEPLARYKSGVPDELQRIVSKALDKDTDTRYQHIDDLAADLKKVERSSGSGMSAGSQGPPQKKRRPWRTLSFAALGVAAVIAGYILFRPSVESAERIPVAVSDFENNTNEAELDGLSGMLITSLEQSRRLSVVTRSHMFDILKQMGNGNEDRIDEGLGKEICRRAGVNTLILASIRRFDQLYIIDLKVLDPQKNEYLFTTSEKAEGKGNIPAMIDLLSERTRSGLREHQNDIRAASRNITTLTTANLEAYQHYFQGEQLINKLGVLDYNASEAISEFQRAIELDSTFALAYYRLAYVFHWKSRGAEMMPLLAKAMSMIDRVPEKERYLVRALHAETDIRGGRTGGEPLTILREMQKLYPNDKEMLFNIGDQYYHNNQFALAGEYFEKVLAIDGEHERSLNHLVLTLRDLKDFDGMVDIAKRFSAVARSAEAYELLADAYVRAGNFDVGLKSLTRELELFPRNACAISIGIAKMKLSEGNLAKVKNEIAVLARSLNAEERVSFLTTVGSMQFRANHPEMSEESFRNALAIPGTPDNVDALNGLGWSLLQQRKLLEAESYFLKGLALDSSSSTTGALSGIITVELFLGKYDVAERHALSYADQLPYITFPLIRLGEIQLSRRNYAAAEQSFRRAFNIDTSDIRISRGFAYLYAEQGYYGKALAYAEKAFTADSGFRNSNLLGWILTLGDIDSERGVILARKAIQHRTETIFDDARFVPYLAIPEHTIALAALKQGKHSTAMKYLEEARRIAPDRQSIRDDLDLARRKLKQ